jgi:Protein involved in initiation of plasmid replication
VPYPFRGNQFVPKFVYMEKSLSDKKVVRTRKRKVEICIPELNNYVMQPNHVTNARYEYTLTQERIFTAIMYGLQDPIKRKLKVQATHQLDLFADFMADDDSAIKLSIPLKDIAPKSAYDAAIKAAEKMSAISVVVPGVGKNNEVDSNIKFFLIRAIRTPAVGGRRKKIEIIVNRDVAEILINIMSNRPGIPSEYTRYMYQIAQSASSKYTSLLYKKICSWRKRGGFTILIDELYKDLCVNNVYLNPDGTVRYKSFKQKVLEKARKELFQQADCWFEYSENYKGNRVHSLTFKIITPELEEVVAEQKAAVRRMFKEHFRLTDKDIDNNLAALFSDHNFDYPFISNRTAIIYMAMSEKRNARELVDPKAYALVSLKNLVKEIEQRKE